MILLLHLALMLVAAPLAVGLIRRLSARLVGASGPPVLQPWRDLARLLRKQPVVPETTSWLFRTAPAASLAATLAAMSLVPSLALGMATAPLSDLLVIAGLLALARATLVLAAMDASGVSGLGATREMTLAAIAAPAFFLVAFTLALLAGTSNLDTIAATVLSGTLGLRISMALALAAACTVALVAAGRMPTTDPNARNEHAMGHAAMTLEFSGRHLAMIELAAALRLLLWMSLIVACFLPAGIAPRDADGPTLAPWLWLLGSLAWSAKILIMAAALAAFETARARRHLSRVPDMLGMAVLLGLLAAIFLFVSQGFAQGMPP